MVIGSTISHYRIVEKLGEGGMGVVYKAEDTTLDRPVALKFLADHLLNDEEAKQRFLREAKAAAALHHPNVCPVYEIAEADGKTFLAMAFLEGEALEDRIAKGPLPIKDALDIARQVAEGLEAAHEKGIVHRDIKPANIIVDDKGHATIMDFGLARLTEASRLTKTDSAMGTVAYMSPEQAQGQDVDHRTDIWALGCVLYEIVAGQRPFTGEYDQALLYEIVHEEPAPLTSIRAGVPMELEFIVGKCLAKEREDRYNGADELSKDLRTLGEKLKSGRSTILRTGAVPSTVPAGMTAAYTVNPIEALPPDAVVMKRKSKLALQALAAVLGLALAADLAIRLTETTPQPLVRRFAFSQDGLLGAKISPDGRYVAFTARDARQSAFANSLWLRALDSESARPVQGAEDMRQGGFAWSPDSQSIVYATFDQLRRVSIDGGAPVRVCDLPAGNSFAGAAWSPSNDRIVFSAGNDLWEVPVVGGDPELLLEHGQGDYFQFPYFLSSRAIAYVANLFEPYPIEVLDLETRERSVVAEGIAPAYDGAGYLLHHTPEFGLAATPFSVETLQATAGSFPVAEAGVFASVSRDGTLIYLDNQRTGDRQMVIRDRTGRIVRNVGAPVTGPNALAASPTGSRIAASIDGDVWIYDLDRDLRTRLTSASGNENRPSWFSEEEVTYGLETAGLATRVADASADPVPIMDSAPGLFFFDWSQDTRYLVYTADGPAGGEGGIWYRERASDGTLSDPVPFLRTPFGENAPSLSPDGRFVAYRSNESGRDEVYVRPFPEGPGKWQVSSEGVSAPPQWSADGAELYYQNGATLMAVSVSTENGFTVSSPELLFESDDLLGLGVTSIPFSAFPGGQRFATFAVLDAEREESRGQTAHIVQNWLEEFRDREQ